MDIETYLSSLESSIANLPSLMTSGTIDPELQNEYAEQLEWMLRQFPTYFINASATNALRLSANYNKLFQMKDQLLYFMEITILPPEQVLKQLEQI